MKHPLVLLTAADATTRRDVAATLVRFGYDVLAARDGDEALALLRAQGTRNVVLVADVEVGGLALAREARGLRPELGVVYTAIAPHRVDEAAKMKGAPLMRAPYGAHQLVGVIAGLGRRVLDEPAASPLAA